MKVWIHNLCQESCITEECFIYKNTTHHCLDLRAFLFNLSWRSVWRLPSGGSDCDSVCAPPENNAEHPGMFIQLQIQTQLFDGTTSTCVTEHIIRSREKVLGVCLQPQCEIASGYQTLLSPDIVKGFLPFASLSSLGLKDEKKKKKNAGCVLMCGRACVCAVQASDWSAVRWKKALTHIKIYIYIYRERVLIFLSFSVCVCYVLRGQHCGELTYLTHLNCAFLSFFC